jgi:hypothetical protein
MRVLFLGDIVGRPGCRAVRAVLPRLIDRELIDLVIANCENAVDGAGVDPSSALDLFDAGAHVLTSGNHVWRRKEAIDFLGAESRLIRPANYPSTTPGRGWTLCETADGSSVAVLNLIGRVFMESVDCPFQTADELLPVIRSRAPVIVVDMHAEATSEKMAMGWFLDGRVACVLGTHTHVQTADERLLPAGTAYITDVGMCGPSESVIGVRKEIVLHRFLTKMPVHLEVAGGPVAVQGVIVEIDSERGLAQRIRRVHEVWEA